MLLTLTLAREPATDLGYLLGKHPDRCQAFELPFGVAHVFYPEASPARCTAALLLEIDPIDLVRRGEGATLSHYVNDRPYVASSFLSVALSRVLGAAMGGRCREKPALAAEALPLEATLSAAPCRGGERFLRRLFEPLGYAVEAERVPLDPAFPRWGAGRLFRVTLRNTCTLSSLLTHLYTLVPVLDDQKHYWVGEDELAKLMEKGEGWLAAHPEREEIARRYLKRQGWLVRQAQQLFEAPEEAEAADPAEEAGEERLSLNDARDAAVIAALRDAGARRVLDAGCGEGRLLRKLAAERWLERVTGADVSPAALEIAARRLDLERLPEKAKERLKLLQSSLLYRDARLAGHDAVALVEVIEHVEPERLPALARTLFGELKPETAIITTPNREYNALFPGLAAGNFRHRDHRFEWTRAELRAWAEPVARAHGYTVIFSDIGPVDAERGAPTQMALFRRSEP